MSRCEPGKLDLDLDEEVSRDALADCLASGWTAAEIAEELGLDGADDVARWCAYHELPLPRVAESLPPPPAPAVKVKEKAPTVPPDKEAVRARREAQAALRRADEERSKRLVEERRAKRAAAPKTKIRERVGKVDVKRLARNARRRELWAAKKAAQDDTGRLKTLTGEARDMEIVRLYESGVGSYTLSKRFELSPSTVLSALKRRGVTMRGCDQSERNANIAALLKQGLATKEVAAAFDVSDGVVRDVAKKAGLKVKRELEQEARARLDALLRIAVWAMRGAGGSVEQIATVANTTTNQVKLILETP